MDEDSFCRIPTGRFAISLKLFFQAMSVSVNVFPLNQDSLNLGLLVGSRGKGVEVEVDRRNRMD